jgi:hypothetical protein
MKILLLGDYSSLFNNLQDGLQELGHEVTLASTGDSWKNISRDIDLGGNGASLTSKIYRKISPLLKLDELTGFDVVQFINPFYFYHPLSPVNKYLLTKIIKGNGKFFLTAAGDDAYYWSVGRRKLAYGPFEDSLKYDFQKKQHVMSGSNYLEFNRWVVEKSDGVIPIMYEYEVSYEGEPKLLTTIPIPLNLKKIKYKENVVGDKLVVFHGLNRYGFKGTRHVEEAFKILEARYPNDLELVIDGKLPLDEYLRLMERVNVVIDQTYSYSLGVNGVYALAMGKVVLGGAEPESLLSLGVASSPVINIKPTAESIVDEIETLLQKKGSFPLLGFSSRRFTEQLHSHTHVAKMYLKLWEKN